MNNEFEIERDCISLSPNKTNKTEIDYFLYISDAELTMKLSTACSQYSHSQSTCPLLHGTCLHLHGNGVRFISSSTDEAVDTNRVLIFSQLLSILRP